MTRWMVALSALSIGACGEEAEDSSRVDAGQRDAADLGPEDDDAQANMTDASFRAAPHADDASAADASVCSRAVSYTRSRDTLWLVLERTPSAAGDAASMRWDALRDVLVAPTGVLGAPPEGVDIGGVFHGVTVARCPALDEVPPSAAPLASFQAAYSADSSEATSSAAAYAMERILGQFTAGAAPTHVLLVRNDSRDDLCASELASVGAQPGEGPVLAAKRVVASLQQSAARGLDLLVLDLAPVPSADPAQVTPDFLASAGRSGHDVFRSDGGDALAATVRSAVEAARSCAFTIDADVPLQAPCDLRVESGGRALACNQPDGYRMRDEHTLELLGSACATVRNILEPDLSVYVPCE